MTTRNCPKVLMLGTDVSTKGGIATVIRDYIDGGLKSRLNIQFVATHRDGSKATNVMFFLQQFPKIVLKIIPAKIVHLNTAHGWSNRRLSMILFIAQILGKKLCCRFIKVNLKSTLSRLGRQSQLLFDMVCVSITERLPGSILAATADPISWRRMSDTSMAVTRSSYIEDVVGTLL